MLSNFEKLKYKVYKRKVLNITKRQPINLLENNHLRGLHDYHLDHIVSIKVGYLNKIDPEIIGNIKNLRFIPSKQNLTKSRNCEDGMLQYLIEELL